MSVTTKEITPSFNSEVTKKEGGQHLNRCFSCGACSGICPVSQAIPDFDPRKIIHMVRMGLKDRLLKSDLLWFCSQCKSCVFVCPQDVRFAEIVEALWDMGGIWGMNRVISTTRTFLIKAKLPGLSVTSAYHVSPV
jgi:heterodisulfide reductase subunit C